MLLEEGVDLRVAHGQATDQEREKGDHGVMPWALEARNTYLPLGGYELCWQHMPPLLRAPDLIVLTQENRLLSNYWLLLKRRFGGAKIGFWGHGANFQDRSRRRLPAALKRWVATKVDWWFAYTHLSANLVVSYGFPRERVTNLENSIDTSALQRDLLALQPGAREEARCRIAGTDARIGLFLGSLHADKRLEFLFEAADRIKDTEPGFHLLVVGDGPLREWVRAETARRPWCHWLGAQYGKDKALCLAISDVVLNPGMVGLGILDAFVAGVPLLTTDCDIHSPEIAYLQHGENGLITENSIAAFVASVSSVLRSPVLREQLCAAARVSATRYTIENMATNFASGIARALRT